ncbi:MAG: ion transporter [Bacteroidota bacterium]
MRRIRNRVYQLLTVSENGLKDFSGKFDAFLMTVIVLNVAAIILESVQEIYLAYKGWFVAFELFSVIFFSIEYVARVWSITADANYAHPIKGRIKFIFSGMALVDLFAILPFYLGVLGFDLRFIRILRIFRLFRMFKIVRYVSALRIITNVFRQKREELVISLVFILFILLIVSCLMFYVEKDVPGTQFTSIPATMWWGVATLTTVGYGDIYPVTPMGRFFGGVIAILGIGLFALPTGILAAGCADEISQRRAKEAEEEETDEGICPHCGRPILAHASDHGSEIEKGEETPNF